MVHTKTIPDRPRRAFVRDDFARDDIVVRNDAVRFWKRAGRKLPVTVGFP